MLFSNVITTLSAFAALTFATDSSTVRVSTSTVLDCSTVSGKNSVVPVPTVIKTTTKYSTACKGTSTFTPTQTITPPPKTSTSKITRETVLTTTNTAITDVFSTTSTAFVTETSSIVITSPSIFTSSFTEFVSETVTETVPTSAGFLPAASTTPTVYPNAVPPPRKRFMTRAKEDSSSKNRLGNILNGWGDAKYPQSVLCVNTVKVLTTTIYIRTGRITKTTTLATSTEVIQVTTTTTSISTVVPAKVTITSSFSTTSTISVTSISTVILPTTVSTTETVAVTSTSSLYAACTGSNLFGPQVPNGFVKNPVGQPSDFTFVTAATAYDCCVKCLLSTTCTGSFARTGATSCILVKANQCAAQGLSSGSYTVGSVGTGQTFTVSNSNCGYMYQLG